MSHHNLGEAFQKLGRPKDALRELRLAAQRYRRSCATPSSNWVSGLLAQSLTTIADVETEIGGSRESACCMDAP